MPSKTKQLAENALMLGIALVMLFLSTYTVFGFVTNFLIPVPFLLLGLRRTVPTMLWISLAFAVLGGMFTGLFGAFIALMSALCGATMGIMYTRRGTALSAIFAGAGVVFLSYLFLLASMTFVMHTDWNALLKPLVDQMQEIVPKEQLDAYLTFLKKGVPSMLVMGSLWQSVIVHWLGRLIGRRVGRQIPALKPIREWSFPKSLLYYYFLAMISMIVFGDSMKGTFWDSAVLNVKIMLDFLLTIQGFAFCLFAANLYGWKRSTPVVIVCLFIFSFLGTILTLLGIFDLGIGLREKLETRVKRG